MDLWWERLRFAVYGAVAGAALMFFSMFAAREPKRNPPEKV